MQKCELGCLKGLREGDQWPIFLTLSNKVAGALKNQLIFGASEAKLLHVLETFVSKRRA